MTPEARADSARPRIVCLCGSTRFWQAFRDEGLKETLAGRIVLSIGISAPDSEVFAHADDAAGRETKAKLDVLHKHKIDLADEVYVLNVGGYIGASTTSEIAYALRRGKPLRWLEAESEQSCLIAVMQAYPAWEPMPPLPGQWPAIRAAVEEEREACAKIAESGNHSTYEAGDSIAAAVRGRGRG